MYVYYRREPNSIFWDAFKVLFLVSNTILAFAIGLCADTIYEQYKVGAVSPSNLYKFGVFLIILIFQVSWGYGGVLIPNILLLDAYFIVLMIESLISVVAFTMFKEFWAPHHIFAIVFFLTLSSFFNIMLIVEIRLYKTQKRSRCPYPHY